MKPIVVGSVFAAVSGFCSLAFQTLWYKQLALVIGIDVYATSIVIGGFLLGVGLGSLCFSRYVNRITNLTLAYASLEACVALSALIVSSVLYLGIDPYLSLEAIMGDKALLVYSLLLAVPPFFMGGTLLLLIRWLEIELKKTIAGTLYGMNILGAVIGALSAPTILMPLFGIIHSIWLVVAVNLMLAMTSYFFITQTRASVADTSADKQGHIVYRKTLIALYATSGFVAIGMEIIWIQTVVQYMNTRAFAYATILSVLLLGLMAGNFTANRLKLSSEKSYAALLFVMLSAMIATILPYLLINESVWMAQLSLKSFVFESVGQAMASNAISFIFIAFFFVFFGAFFFGCVFVLALKVQQNEQSQARFSGELLGFNTIAGVIATFVVGFWLVPLIGAINTVKVLSGLILLVVVCATYFSQHRLLVMTTCALLVVVTVVLPKNRLSEMLVAKEGGNLLWFEEGIGNTVAVIEQGEGKRKFRRLYIQGVSNTGDVMASLRYMRLQSYIPALVAPQPPRKALVIGLGTGITAGALTNIESLEVRHVFELLPEVQDATRLFKGNYLATNQPSDIDVFIGDGRHQLSRSGAEYDLITLEPPPPTASGVSNLYSDDFYKLAKKRLSDSGVLAQWWPIATQSVEASRSIVATMLNNFKYVTLWSTEVHEMLLVGSDEPQTLSFDQASNFFSSNPKIEASLLEVGVSSYESLLATYVGSRKELEQFVHTDTPLITDDYPLLEFDEWTNELVITEVMPELINLFTLVPTVKEERAAQAKLEQDKLVAFYIATMAAYEKQPDIWLEYMNWVLKQDPNNEYFIWFKPDS
ncbi:fused MFS/spermidine synthase [Vibrio barjaei]|uniref:fused MFS/spermidine synthase n=1 Tax=Vibrio barjaei TaxID=1676683 RepID=UPI0007BB5D8A|nr:fused MFS/spermidine synthase [Vibrio barjaei]OIN25591.1 hypothetical protein AWH66_2015040 [Vibrio barjaei]